MTWMRMTALLGPTQFSYLSRERRGSKFYLGRHYLNKPNSARNKHHNSAHVSVYSMQAIFYGLHAFVRSFSMYM